MNPETGKAKPLTKEETKLLLSFVESSKIIISKSFDATNNRLKNEEWQRITNEFNGLIKSGRRTPQQLRLKWENLKKNSRKFRTDINFEGSAPAYIPSDEILNRVANLLSITVKGHTVKFGGDTEPEHFKSCSNNDVFVLEEESHSDREAVSRTPEGSRKSLKTPRARGFKRKIKINKRKALTNCFGLIEKVLESKLEGMLLQNEKLKLENEKLKLELHRRTSGFLNY